MFDDYVIQADVAHKRNIAKYHQQINHYLGLNISMHDLISQIPNILAGKQTKFFILNQARLIKSIGVDSRLIELMAEIQKIIQERLLLFEDMSGFSETSDSSEIRFDESITRLTSHSFLKRNKVDRLIELLQELPGQSKILIFVRNKSICEGLSEILQGRGFCLIIYSQ